MSESVEVNGQVFTDPIAIEALRRAGVIPVGGEVCPCGTEQCAFVDTGYPWCVRCMDHHRPWPDCPGLTEDGENAELRGDEG